MAGGRGPRAALAVEAAAFALLAALIWVGELFDLPQRWIGAPRTPVNVQEALVQSLAVLLVGALATGYTARLLRRLKRLEGVLPICSACKKIRDDAGEWRSVEGYVRERSDAEFSHGLCPHCLRRLYPEFAEGDGDAGG